MDAAPAACVWNNEEERAKRKLLHARGAQRLLFAKTRRMGGAEEVAPASWSTGERGKGRRGPQADT